MSTAEVTMSVNAAEDRALSWGEFCSGLGTSVKERSAGDWAKSMARIVGLCAALYMFLFSLDLMGSAFKVVGSCTAGGMFDGITNPIAGLMIGVLATVLVQSSSTTTSVVVSIVGAGGMGVQTAIPVIMGANIGTSVTNTIVSMGQITDADQYERAFAGATVHDMFNFLTVLVLLPVELITGMLFHLTKAMVPEEVVKGEKWVGPIKIIVDPFLKLFLSIDSKLINKLADSTKPYTCAERYAAVAESAASGLAVCAKGSVQGIITCSCNKETNTISACPAFYTANPTQSDEMAAGAVALVISLILLCLCLFCLVKLLQSMVMDTSSRMLRKATSVNGYLAILVGCVITILVQSSSITTSVLTPLVGVGVIPLDKMLPLTLGANIGTTATALLASLVSTSPDSVQIALCHLFFNIFGILIWYPVPLMRRVPTNAAILLGQMTRRYKSFPLVYIAFMFGLLPGLLLGVSSLFDNGGAYVILGVMIVAALCVFVGCSLFWWNKRDGKNKLFASLEKRDLHAQTTKDLVNIVAELRTEIDHLKKAVAGTAPVDAKLVDLDV